jgi:putative endonuclease
MTGKYYIGYSNDVLKRLNRHNNGGVKSTKRDRPWCLVYKEVYEDKKSAMDRERYLKSMKSRVYIEGLIDKRAPR